MIKASDLIADFRAALDEKWGYIWGKSGQVWTQANQDAATRDMTVKHGSKWIGRKVADCSGLFVWAYKRHGEKIYHGSNTIWNEYVDKNARGAISGTVYLHPGTAVFQVNDGRRTHIGLYIGMGRVIEAKGTISGVVESGIDTWDEWGDLLAVDYRGVPAEKIEAALPILRKGNEGEAVTDLQQALVESGYDVGKRPDGTPMVDGKYGRETLSAVRAFQHDNGLKPDGIVGPQTWDALRNAADDEPADSKPPEDQEPEAPAPTIEERLTRLERAVFGQEGGGTNAELDPAGG